MSRPRDRLGRLLPPGSADELEPFRMPRSCDEALRLGVRLFGERRYFEAHECFEALWKSDRTDESDRRFWKGVTQIAVGCCHLQRDNPRGALALLDRAAGALSGFPSPHRGVDTRRLLEAAGRLTDAVRRGDRGDGLPYPDLPLSG